MKYKLTPKGLTKTLAFIAECKAKRKEILDVKKDTADETELPTVADILSDVEFFDYGPEDDVYCNCWGVTDNYNSDVLILEFGKDIIAVK